MPLILFCADKNPVALQDLQLIASELWVSHCKSCTKEIHMFKWYIMLTLIFNHVLPLISYSFPCFLWGIGSKNNKSVICLNHLRHSGPILTLFWHLGHRKPILIQSSTCEHISQPLWSVHIVFNYDGNNLSWIFRQERLHFFQSINCRLLRTFQ